jgi:hypothetical protein
MQMDISILRIYDYLCYEYVLIDEFYRKVPRGVYIYEDTEAAKLYQRKENSRLTIQLVADILGVSWYMMDKFMLTVRRWYRKHGGRCRLPCSDFERLWRYYANYA